MAAPAKSALRLPLSLLAMLVLAPAVDRAAHAQTISFGSVAPPELTIAPGASGRVDIGITRTNYTGSLTLTVMSSLPTGVTTTIVQPGTTTNGSVTFNVGTSAQLVTNSPIRIRASGTGVSSIETTVSLTIARPPGISGLTASPSTLEIAPGANGTSTVTFTRTGSFTGSVTLSVVSTLPSGVTASYAQPGTSNSGGVTLAVSTSAALGDTTVRVRASNTSIASVETTFTLRVARPDGITNLTASPSTLTVAPGTGATETVTFSRVNGFSGNVTLSVVSALPTGVTATFSQPGTSSSGSVTLSASTSVALGDTTVRVRAANSSINSVETTFTLRVQPPAGLENLVLSPSPLLVAPGGSNTLSASFTRTGGFSGSVTLAVTSALPSGVSVAYAQPGSGNSGSLTFSASTAVTLGDTTVTVRASGTGVSSIQSTFTLRVQPPAGLANVVASPSPLVVAPGASGTESVTFARVGGFTGNVVLSVVSTLPVGVTASFVQPGTTNSGSVTLSAATAVALGDVTVRVWASGTGISTVEATFVLSVARPPGLSDLVASPLSIAVVPGSSASTTLSFTRVSGFAGSVSFAVISTLPSGVTAAYTQPGTGNSGAVILAASTAVAIGDVTVRVRASATGIASVETTFTLQVRPPPGLSNLSATPNPLQVTQGGAATATVTFTRVGGFADAVTLAVVGSLPAGVTATYGQPGTGVSGTVVLSATAAAIVGDVNVTVRAAGTGITAVEATFVLRIVPPPGLTGLVASPNPLNVFLGSSATESISFTRVGGFTGAVTLSVTSTLPAGVTVSFAQPGTANAGAVTVAATASTAQADLSVRVRASGAGITPVETVFTAHLVPAPGISTLGATPSPLVIARGGAGSVTVTFQRVGGYTGSVSLEVTGTPAGVTASVGQPGTTSSGSITMTAATSAVLADTTISVRATGTGITAVQTTFTLRITDAPGLGNVTVTPTPLVITGGSSGTSNIGFSRIGAFTGSVTLSITSSLPSGVTPTVQHPGTTSAGTVTFAASSTTPTGDTTVGLRLSAAGITPVDVQFVLRIAPAPAIRLTASPNPVAIVAGGSGTETITIERLGGYIGTVTLSAAGLPSGVTVNIGQPGSGATSALTITVAASAAITETTVVVTGSGTGIASATTTFVLRVTDPPGLGNVQVSPSEIRIPVSLSADANVTFTRLGGFSGVVTLSVVSIPTGITATVVQPGTGTSGRITYQDLTAPAGTYTTQVRLSGTGITPVVLTFPLRVFAPISNLTVTPGTATMATGGDATVGVTFTRSPYYSGSVSLAVIGTLPSSVGWSFVHPGTANAGSVKFNASVGSVAPASLTAVVRASGAGMLPVDTNVQLSITCSPTLSPTAFTMPPAGGTGTLAVLTSPGCNWTATDDASWFGVSPSSGQGATNLTYSVEPNPGAQRTAVASISGATFTLVQEGRCSLTCEAFVAPTASVYAPVDFTGRHTASGCSGGVQHAWNFGDAASAAVQNTLHTYQSQGTYAWTYAVTSGSTTCRATGEVAVGETTGVVSGVVTDADTGQVLGGVTVSTATRTATTTSAGSYTLNGVPSGAAMLRTSAAGYAPLTVETGVVAGSTVKRDLALSRVGDIRVLGVTSRFKPGTFFLDGARLPVRFTASIDWGGRTPREVLWHTPKGTQSTAVTSLSVVSATREFDMGADFGACARLQVQAVAQDGTRSPMYDVDFVVAAAAPVPAGVLDLLVDRGDSFSFTSSTGELTSLVQGILAIEAPGDLDFLSSMDLEAMPDLTFTFDSSGQVSVAASIPAAAFGKKAKEFGTIHIGKLELALSAELEFEGRFDRRACTWEASGFVGIAASGEVPSVLSSPFILPLPPPLPPVPAYWKIGGDYSVTAGLELGWQDGFSLRGTIVPEVSAFGRVAAGVDNFFSVGGQLTVTGEAEVVLPRYEDSSATLSLEAEVGVYSFANITFTLFRCEIGTEHDPSCSGPLFGSPIDSRAMAALYAGEGLQPLSRHYLDRPAFGRSSMAAMAATAVGAEGASVPIALVTEAFPFPEVSLGGGGSRLVAIWLTDDSSRSANNRTLAVSSVRNGSSWTTPTPIEDDGTADFHPQVVGFADGGAVAVWEDASTLHQDGARYEAILASLDITASVYDPLSKNWAPPFPLAANTWLDFGPRICGSDGQHVTALWLSNAWNSAGSALEPTTILSRTWDGQRWSAEVTVATTPYRVVQHQLACDSSRAVVVLSVDIDGNSATIADRELLVAEQASGTWGALRRMTTDTVDDTSPQVVFAGDRFVVVWTRGNALVASRDFVPANLTTLAPSSEGPFNGLRAAANASGQVAITWIDVQGKDVDLKQLRWNAVSSMIGGSSHLTDDSVIESGAATALYPDGRLAAIYAGTRAAPEVGVVAAAVAPGFEGTSTGVYYVEQRAGARLTIVPGSAELAPAAPAPGAPARLGMRVQNTGDLSAEDVVVVLQILGVGGGEVGRAALPTALAPGTSQAVDVAFTMPASTKALDWRVTISIRGDDGQSSLAVAQSAALTSPDWRLDPGVWQSTPEGRFVLPIRARNAGTAEAGATTITARAGATSGKSIWTRAVEGRSAGSFLDIELVWDTSTQGPLPGALVLDIDEGNLIAESDEQNNRVAVLAPNAMVGDADADGMPDAWESAFGLRPSSGLGADGPLGDPDQDGVPNIDEWRAGTHPRGSRKRFLAEGATTAGFETSVALLNPSADAASANLLFLLANGQTKHQVVQLLPHSRATVDVGSVTGMSGAEFATTIESDRLLVVDRTVTWGQGTGSHSERALVAPSTTWYLAEGATHSGFDLFYLLQNPSDRTTNVRVRYLLPAGAPLEKTYQLGPTSRTNIWVNKEAFGSRGLALASTDVSAVIESLDGAPIIVERAMYLSRAGRPFDAGHESAGVTAPATSWFLAEGATGSYLDLFVLLANPNSVESRARVTYLLPDGTTYRKSIIVPANSRQNIWVDYDTPDGTTGFPLADTAVSTTVEVTNGVPIIVERAMWWPGTIDTWYEAHNSAGATVTGTQWAMAEGEVGGAPGHETYILIANTSASVGEAAVTLMFEDGTTSTKRFVLAATSRTNVAVAAEFPEAVGRRFGAVVESIGTSPVQIVVERAMYSNAAGVAWAAGTNALATRLR